MENQAYAASSSSAPSYPASTSYPHYDVFINYFGPDVKNTFADRLYRRLVENGLRVFLDKPEMRPGELIESQIRAAIDISHVQVAIFSPGYAQSKWCLDELVLMLKTTERAINRATIRPVFYNVEPSHLRYAKGAYAEALSNHEKKGHCNSDTIESWRKALSRAADISGFELDGDEDKLLREVVQGVLKIFYPHYDVFINHGGPGGNNTFAARLYRRLVEKGLRVFLHVLELSPGQLIQSQISAAIDVAQVHVAIFSPEYAQAIFCMDELKLMLKTTKRALNRATILPVFYNVEPSHLRHRTTGPYAEALSKHENRGRCDSNTIESWREALSSAAVMNGFELDGDEDELVRKVVEFC